MPTIIPDFDATSNQLPLDAMNDIAHTCNAYNSLEIGPGLLGEIGGNANWISSDSPKVVVKEVQDDMLRCHWWNAQTKVEGTTDVFVAKPPLLQRTPFDGKTIEILGESHTYTYSDSMSRLDATDSDDTTIEVVTPPWTVADPTNGYIGDVIEVAYDPTTGLTDPNSQPVIWRDTNDGGRIFLPPVVDTPVTEIWVQITGSSPIIHPPDGTHATAYQQDQWLYAGVQYKRVPPGTMSAGGATLTWEPVSPTKSITLINSMEAMNTGAGLEGNGITYPFPPGSGNFHLQPIPVGAIVRVFIDYVTVGGKSTPVYAMCIPNGDDGSCS